MSEDLLVVDGPSYEVSARIARGLIDRPLGEGVDGRDDLRVTAGAAGLSVDVASGVGFVRGDTIADQGLYRVRNDAAKSSAAFAAGGFGAADATNPRIDQVVMRVYDHVSDGLGLREARLAIVAGTPTAGATLDNRSGAAGLPSSAMLLADVLVPAAFAGPFVQATHIRDRRAFSKIVVPPLPLNTGAIDREQVAFQPIVPRQPAVPTIAHASHDLHQAAVARILPRRIANATRIHWKYVQNSATALAGNYTIAIFDSSGRLVVAPAAATAFAGAVSTIQPVAITIPATTFEAGMYYVMIGVDSTAGQAYFSGDHLEVGGTNLPHVGHIGPNMAVRLGSGGTTVPNTLFGFSDVHALAVATSVPSVPDISLSVA